jgi:predicted transcriptional regulator
MLKERIKDFLVKVDGRSYSSKSLSKVLNLNHETGRKYLRELYQTGGVRRFPTKQGYRYYW